MSAIPFPPREIIDRLLLLGRSIRDAVIAARTANTPFAGVSRHAASDTIYQLDAHVEPILESFCEQWSKKAPLVLIAEGLDDDAGADGTRVFPRGSNPDRAAFRLIVDPIDGTRGLMYDKRPAWVLMAVAANHGPATSLADIKVAVQVEVPTTKQNLADVLWAIRGHGAHAARDDLSQHTTAPLHFFPSTATTLAHGFGSISNFFPGTKILGAQLMERIVERTLGRADIGKALVFDDQYISTAGQFYELIIGHDRFNADLRPLFYQIRNLPLGTCCHPYDVCTALIAEEAGIMLTNAQGGPLTAPLDVHTPITFSAFANAALHASIDPIIREFLAEPPHLLNLTQ